MRFFNRFLQQIKLLLQTNLRIFNSQINQLFLLSSLRFENLRIYHSLNSYIINIRRNQNFIGNQMRFFLIKLTNIGQKILIGIIVIRKHIHISLNEFSLTDKENLHTHPSFVHIIAKDIPILQISCHHSLLSAKRRNTLKQISVFSRFFKFHLFSSTSHFSFQFINNLIIMTFEEICYFLSHILKKMLLIMANSVSSALSDVVVETNLLRRIGTLAKRENSIQQTLNFID